MPRTRQRAADDVRQATRGRRHKSGRDAAGNVQHSTRSEQRAANSEYYVHTDTADTPDKPDDTEILIIIIQHIDV